MSISRISAKTAIVLGALLVASALGMGAVTSAFAATALGVSSGVITLGHSDSNTNTECASKWEGAIAYRART